LHVGLRLLRHSAASLRASQVESPATLIKVIRYPGITDTVQGVGAHKDSGVLTLLLAEPGSAGLQVEVSPEYCIDVPPVDGTFIVNIGELLEVATDGYLRATRHRVPAPLTWRRLPVDPALPQPSLDVTGPIITLPPDLSAQSCGVEADPNNPIYNTYGKNAWTWRIRAHRDVAERPHGIAPTAAASLYLIG
jgi:isopenicillin N synthase-like dioxygenase